MTDGVSSGRQGSCPLALVGLLALGLVVSGGSIAAAGAACSPSETVVDLRVHGNQALPDTEVLRLAGVVLGDQVVDGLEATIEERLLASGHFESVEVRKRYLSLSVTTDVALVIVVTERAVSATMHPAARLLAEIGQRALFLPLLDYEEGYGATFGARTSFVEVLGEETRVSVPATWGGTKAVALELDARGAGWRVDRLQGRLSVSRREHPRFGVDDHRTGLWARVDHRLPARVGLAAEGGWEDVRFGQLDDALTRLRLAADLDTRTDRLFPRDAVWAEVSYEWLRTDRIRRVVGRPRVRAEVYQGLFGQAVLALRAGYHGSSAALPLYEQPMLGGADSLRGWPVGAFVGDRRIDGSVEIRFPLDSPLSVGRMGGTLFFDTGTVSNVGAALRKSRFRHGLGVGLFSQLPIVQLRLDVAHNLVEGVRAHVGAGVSF